MILFGLLNYMKKLLYKYRLRAIPNLLISAIILSSASIYAQNMQDVQKKMLLAKRMLDSLKTNPEFQQKMKLAQHKLDSLKSDSKFQSAMQRQRKLLDSLQEKKPAIRNVNLPDNSDLNVAKMPDLDSLENNLKNQYSIINKYTQPIHQSIPKANPLHHADGITKLTNNSLLALVNSFLEESKSKLSTGLLRYLDAMVKDKNLNLAGTGAFLLATGASRNAALFLICHDILKNPNDAWAVNDLGVYFRDTKDISKALQCYFYANALLNGKAVVINTNIGWASFYYGDFKTAQQYFNQALSGNNKFNSAREGKAMVGYAQGNTSALFSCLSDEINNISSSGGFKKQGPSENFVATCAGIFMEKEVINNQNGNTNPTSDRTFNNNNPVDEGVPQDPPPGADVEPVTYPSYKPAFVGDAKDLEQAVVFAINKTREYTKREADYTLKLITILKALPPLFQAPYVDDENYLVYPNTFKKYIDIFHLVQVLFEKRTAWYYKKYDREITKLRKSIPLNDMDLMNRYFKALSACGLDDKCKNKVNCEWIPRLHGSKNSDIDAVARVWNKYSDNIHNTIQWYINATAPLISRVHQIKWNQYLNVVREVDVRKAILKTYYEWNADLLFTQNNGEVCAWGTRQVPTCPVEIARVNEPDPFSKKPKHIKEFQGPCYNQTYPLFMVGGIESTCHGDKFYIGGGPFKVFYSHTSDQIAAQNQGYSNKLGLDVGVSKDIDIIKVGEGDEEKSLLSASGELKGSININFDNNWNFTGGNSSVNASVSIAGQDIFGVGASRSVEMVDGQANVSPLSVTTTGILH